MDELLELISEYGRNCETLGYMDCLEKYDPLWRKSLSDRTESWTKITQWLLEDELNREG